ncbi:hypothetical protein AKJ16_DCAP18363 [Drosera capensis]
MALTGSEAIKHSLQAPHGFQEVHWGEATMVDAERRLLACREKTTSQRPPQFLKREIHPPESCIPLFNFTEVSSGFTQAFAEDCSHIV